jgi:PKD domain
LDGSLSRGRGLRYEWTFTDGGHATGARVERVYQKAGTYCEILKVSDDAGRTDYDFMVVQVIDRAHPDTPPPTIHAGDAPTGYAETSHVYSRPGQYLVSVEHVSANGVSAVARLQVRVGLE